MSITSFYDRTVITQRLSAVSGSYREEYATNLTSLACVIMPLDNASQFYNGAVLKAFKMVCGPTSDILVSDRVIDGSNTYTVKAETTHDLRGSANAHKSLILELV